MLAAAAELPLAPVVATPVLAGSLGWWMGAKKAETRMQVKVDEVKREVNEAEDRATTLEKEAGLLRERAEDAEQPGVPRRKKQRLFAFLCSRLSGSSKLPLTVTRYPDPSPNSRVIWYDVPGAGTPNVPEWQYFNDMGLYIFDCIIVLIDNRVLDSDLAILRACEQFMNVEAFIVRSKSDQHINNMACDRMPRGFDPCDPDMDDESRTRFQQVKSEERRRFIDETRQNVQMNLESGNLSPKKVYIVCKDAVLAVLSNSRSSKAIDEAELLNDVAEGVRRRL
ncbi:hypothetical protein DFH29DRAFT_1031781 [Suillus ampliporus]|nr:hypothetical protein DFH29DRAFT_1031781 [Suillus ampliporus]